MRVQIVSESEGGMGTERMPETVFQPLFLEPRLQSSANVRLQMESELELTTLYFNFPRRVRANKNPAACSAARARNMVA